MAINFGFLDPEPLLNYPHEAEWTPFPTHYFSENLVAPGIEPGTYIFKDKPIPVDEVASVKNVE
jgi:hypothetical protein